MKNSQIGIIGGSGLYQLDGLVERGELEVETPYGKPSDPLRFGELAGTPLVFLARHGAGHRLLPGEVPYRANIYALKSVGVRYIISVSAVGSLATAIRPRDVVLPDQFIDMTRHRPSTFFGDGVIAHVSMAEPTSAAVRGALAAAYKRHGRSDGLHEAGTYLVMEGPQFSSLAESELWRQFGASVIGMTNMPEAKLAREAQIAYATLALVTDYDCWHPREANVDAMSALENMAHNVALAQKVVADAARDLGTALPDCPSHSALENAVVTDTASLDAARRARLEVLLG